MAPLLTLVQVAGGVGARATALGSLRAPRDREADLWGRVSIAMATWTYVACFGAAVTRHFTLFGVDRAAGILSCALAIWMALRPPPPAASAQTAPTPA